MSLGPMLRHPFSRLTTKCVQNWSSNMVDRWPAWPIQWSFCFELFLLLQLQNLSMLCLIGSNSTKFFPQVFSNNLKKKLRNLTNLTICHSFKLFSPFSHMGAGLELVNQRMNRNFMTDWKRRNFKKWFLASRERRRDDPLKKILRNGANLLIFKTLRIVRLNSSQSKHSALA